MTARHAEVIVVGGGPAGAAIAGFLARAGVDILVLDRARFPRAKPCAEYLSPQAAQPLDELGVLEAVERAGGAQLNGMRITAPDGTTFQGSFVGAHGYRPFRDTGIALPRTVLDAMLLRHAASLGARVEEDVHVTGLAREGGAVVGVQVQRSGSATTIRAPLVIGADGLRSVVARRLDLRRTSRWPRRYAFVWHMTGVSAVGSVGEMLVFRDGYAGLADVGGGTTNVAIVVPHGVLRARADSPERFVDDWIASHPALAVRVAEAHRTDDIQVTGPFAASVRRAWAPGAALVGDAADFFDPFTGEGIFAALRGARVLLPYAFDACRAATAERRDIALAAWDRARTHEFAGKWRVERLVGRAVGAPALFNRAARTLSERRDMADLLIGVAGDFVPPSRVLRPSFLARLLIGIRGRAVDDTEPASHEIPA